MVNVNVILASPCKTTRGLLAMDLIILNLDQVTRMTPELALSFPDYHTIPTEGLLCYDRFNAHQPPLYGESLIASCTNSLKSTRRRSEVARENVPQQLTSNFH
ncbi:hypothetical protein TNCV_3635801 [Trichonephila clavipes]|nr:hypothetical protein TNCV_3635801 [Trichonephila clavipes]